MKTLLFCLLCLLAAGCSSTRTAQNGPASSQGTAQSGTTCHLDVVSEFSDGETKFVQFVPHRGF